MENKASRKERLRKMREKYHLGEYRNVKTHSNKLTRRVKMAKRRKGYFRKSRSSLGGASVMGTAIGVGAYILYESLLEPKIASVIGNGMILNVAELAAGVYLAHKSGIVGNIGKAAIVINTYQILQPLLQGVMPQ